MSAQDASTKLQEAVQELAGNRPIRVIFAENDDIRVVVNDTDVRVWRDVEQEEPLSNLTEGREYRFSIAGWPRQNQKGKVMVPIYWRRGVTGWVNFQYFSQVERS